MALGRALRGWSVVNRACVSALRADIPHACALRLRLIGISRHKHLTWPRALSVSDQRGMKLVAFEVTEGGYFLGLGLATFHPNQLRVSTAYEGLH